MMDAERRRDPRQPAVQISREVLKLCSEAFFCGTAWTEKVISKLSKCLQQPQSSAIRNSDPDTAVYSDRSIWNAGKRCRALRTGGR